MTVVIVIVAFLLAEFVTYALATGINLILSQIFYLPILYIAFRFPGRAILANAAIGISYLGILFFFTFHSLSEFLPAVMQFNVYIIISVVIASVAGQMIRTDVKFQEVFRHSGNPVGILDMNSGKFTEANPAFLATFSADAKTPPVPDLAGIFPDPGVAADLVGRIRKHSSVNDFEVATRGSGEKRLDMLLNATRLGNDNLAVITFTDITRRKQAEEKITAAVRESEDVFRTLSQVAPVGIFLTDNQGNLFYVNEQWCRITGLSTESVRGRQWKTLPGQEGDVKYAEDRSRTRDQESGMVSEERFIHDDGTVVWTFIRAVPRTDPGGKISGYVGVIVDITEMKKYEEQLRSSLDEKSVLLMEVHHRVKNNLQVISSLIRLQSRYVTDKKALDAFRQCERRVTTMALVHESLYRSPNIAQIPAAKHIPRLVSSLLAAELLETKVSLETDIDDVGLDLDTAVPCSLIINELVTNSLKHAFHGRETGKIFIGFHRDGDSYTLIVADDGSGVPDGFSIPGAKSLGLKLVYRLVRDQLKGTFDLCSENGARFVVRFNKSTEGNGLAIPP